jgi:hypothetical protein
MLVMKAHQKLCEDASIAMIDAFYRFKNVSNLVPLPLPLLFL